MAERTGTVKILMGFLRVTNGSTDRDRPTYRLTHTLAHAVHGTDCGWHYCLDFIHIVRDRQAGVKTLFIFWVISFCFRGNRIQSKNASSVVAEFFLTVT